MLLISSNPSTYTLMHVLDARLIELDLSIRAGTTNLGCADTT